MRVLVACEYSGTVRDAFIRKGHSAWSCDVLPTDVPGPHYQCDVREIIDNDWDLMIAHPPCTYLANSGVMHLHRDPGRWDLMREAAEFFRFLLEAPVPRICVENPIMHKYGKDLIGQAHSQMIQPWMFGQRFQKSTCLWLKGLPPLQPTNIVDAGEFVEFRSKKTGQIKRQPAWYAEAFHKSKELKTSDRWKIRSTTFQGIADAMAEQWRNSTCKSNELETLF